MSEEADFLAARLFLAAGAGAGLAWDELTEPTRDIWRTAVTLATMQTTAQARARLGISDSYLLRLCKSGRIPGAKRVTVRERVMQSRTEWRIPIDWTLDAIPRKHRAA